MKTRAEARVSFGGAIYLVRCVYPYGWAECSVHAKNDEHARSLMEQWFRSDDGRIVARNLYNYALEELNLSQSRRPGKAEFQFTIEAVTKSDLNTADFEIESVEFRKRLYPSALPDTGSL